MTKTCGEEEEEEEKEEDEEEEEEMCETLKGDGCGWARKEGGREVEKVCKKRGRRNEKKMK